MSCFCHRTIAPLQVQLSLLAAADLALAVPVSPRQALAEALARELAQALAALGLPAAPWQPDPAWLDQPLPQVRLSATALATVSAFAQLRAQALAQFGLDLLVPAQAVAMARIVATLNARLAALPPPPVPAELIRLAALAEAIAQVTIAIQAHLLDPLPALTQAYANPAGSPMSAWHALLAALRSLVPLIAASSQLGLTMDASFAAQLAVALRTLRAISLPPIRFSAMAQLAASLSAVARLRQSLGIDPLQAGMAAVRAQIAARLAAMIGLLPPAYRTALARPGLLSDAELVRALRSLLPKLPFCPSQLATPAVMAAALKVDAAAVAAIDWQVPALSAVPVLQIGLPTCMVAAQVQASVSVQAVLPAPCGSGCDAARIMRGLAA
jgi:hypothetical protein